MMRRVHGESMLANNPGRSSLLTGCGGAVALTEPRQGMSKTIRRGMILVFATLAVCLGVQLPRAAAAPPPQAPRDVLFLFDTTGSMASALSSSSAQAQQVMGALRTSLGMPSHSGLPKFETTRRSTAVRPTFRGTSFSRLRRTRVLCKQPFPVSWRPAEATVRRHTDGRCTRRTMMQRSAGEAVSSALSSSSRTTCRTTTISTAASPSNSGDPEGGRRVKTLASTRPSERLTTSTGRGSSCQISGQGVFALRWSLSRIRSTSPIGSTGPG